MFNISKSNVAKASIGGVVAVALFLAGYLPERMRRVDAERAAAVVRAELDSTEARIRVGILLGQALMLKDLASRTDYGQALDQSTRFFDAVRGEAHASRESDRQRVLMAVLGERDTVTAGLAKSDPTVASTLVTVEQRLREALNYPVVTDPPRAAQTQP